MELFDGAIEGFAFAVGGDDGDEALVDGGVDEVGDIDDQVAVAGLDDELAAALAGFGDDVGGLIGGFLPFEDDPADALEGFEEAVAVDGFEEVVDGFEAEGFDGVVFVGGRQDEEGKGDATLL